MVKDPKSKLKVSLESLDITSSILDKKSSISRHDRITAMFESKSVDAYKAHKKILRNSLVRNNRIGSDGRNIRKDQRYKPDVQNDMKSNGRRGFGNGKENPQRNSGAVRIKDMQSSEYNMAAKKRQQRKVPTSSLIDAVNGAAVNENQSAKSGRNAVRGSANTNKNLHISFPRSGLKIMHGERVGIQVLQDNTNQIKTGKKSSTKPAITADAGTLKRDMKFMASKMGEILNMLELMSASETKCRNPNFSSWPGPQHDTSCTDCQLSPKGVLDRTSHLNSMHGERVGIQVLQHNTNQIKTSKKLQTDTQPTNEYNRALRRAINHLDEHLICIAGTFTDSLTTVNVATDNGSVLRQRQ